MESFREKLCFTLFVLFVLFAKLAVRKMFVFTLNHQTFAVHSCSDMSWVQLSWHSSYSLLRAAELLMSLSYYIQIGFGKKLLAHTGIELRSFQVWVICFCRLTKWGLLRHNLTDVLCKNTFYLLLGRMVKADGSKSTGPVFDNRESRKFVFQTFNGCHD